jgi:hypothetical protein
MCRFVRLRTSPWSGFSCCYTLQTVERWLTASSDMAAQLSKHSSLATCACKELVDICLLEGWFLRMYSDCGLCSTQ